MLRFIVSNVDGEPLLYLRLTHESPECCAAHCQTTDGPGQPGHQTILPRIFVVGLSVVVSGSQKTYYVLKCLCIMFAAI